MRPLQQADLRLLMQAESADGRQLPWPSSHDHLLLLAKGRQPGPHRVLVEHLHGARHRATRLADAMLIVEAVVPTVVRPLAGFASLFLSGHGCPPHKLGGRFVRVRIAIVPVRTAMPSVADTVS